MKLQLLFFYLLFSMTACSYLENQEDEVIVEITNIQNTEEGTLVSFTVQSDDEIIWLGLDFRYPGANYLPVHQILIEESISEKSSVRRR